VACAYTCTIGSRGQIYHAHNRSTCDKQIKNYERCNCTMHSPSICLMAKCAGSGSFWLKDRVLSKVNAGRTRTERTEEQNKNSKKFQPGKSRTNTGVSSLTFTCAPHLPALLDNTAGCAVKLGSIGLRSSDLCNASSLMPLLDQLLQCSIIAPNRRLPSFWGQSSTLLLTVWREQEVLAYLRLRMTDWMQLDET